MLWLKIGEHDEDENHAINIKLLRETRSSCEPQKYGSLMQVHQGIGRVKNTVGIVTPNPGM